MILELFLVTLIITLIYTSGFFEQMDYYVNKKFPPYHLPYPFRCNLCGVFWSTLFWTIVTGNLSLINVALCLLFAHSTHILVPALKTIENALLKVIEMINNLIGY